MTGAGGGALERVDLRLLWRSLCRRSLGLERCARAAERVAEVVEREEFADGLARLLLLGFGFFVSARRRVGRAETVGAVHVVV